MSIRAFMERHYSHFNAGTLVEAAKGYVDALDAGSSMMVTLAGAMSTAELGKSLAEMIRQGKVHAVTCTGANLEEDVFNLVAHSHYKRIPSYRDLGAQGETALLEQGLARVTDTCIPEQEAIRRIEDAVMDIWRAAGEKGESRFPHQFLYDLLRSGRLEGSYDIDPKDSWLIAAAERDLPIYVPGWEDSTLGNIFIARVIDGTLESTRIVRAGVDYMKHLAGWYEEACGKGRAPGFFQIGGGIAGDFPICVVPMLNFDLKRDLPVWSYFCQVSDAVTSYGGYSGAEPNEKITWGKLAEDTPRYVIESDATIVAPLVFAWVLGW